MPVTTLSGSLQVGGVQGWPGRLHRCAEAARRQVRQPADPSHMRCCCCMLSTALGPQARPTAVHTWTCTHWPWSRPEQYRDSCLFSSCSLARPASPLPAAELLYAAWARRGWTRLPCSVHASTTGRWRCCGGCCTLGRTSTLGTMTSGPHCTSPQVGPLHIHSFFILLIHWPPAGRMRHAWHALQ